MMGKNTNCPCKKKSCPRFGDCEACRAYHRSHETKKMTSCEKQRMDREQQAEAQK